MKIITKIIEFDKKYIFTVKKGRSATVKNISIKIKKNGIIGLGEVTLGAGSPYNVDIVNRSILDFFKQYQNTNLPVNNLFNLIQQSSLLVPAKAGLDMAVWDYIGKEIQMPCYDMFGLIKRDAFTSVTVGYNKHSLITEQTIKILSESKARYLKIKLGLPLGVEEDQDTFIKIYEASKLFNVKLRVDANGGWTYSQAIIMLNWLKKYDVEFVEQPLSANDIESQKSLFQLRPLPIFLDESCCRINDILNHYKYCDGVVIKLVKSGGLIEAIKMAKLAKNKKLKVLLGCKSESAVGISASMSISPLFDFIDLDSHFYLLNDPYKDTFCIIDGKISMNNFSGNGILSDTVE